MNVIGVIPARYGSTRFPGKPLTSIHGKPMILWVAEAAKKSKLLSQVIVATDDTRIAEVVEKKGFKAVMTASDIPSGTDRIYQAAQNQKADIVVNIQGDEPLLIPEMLDALVYPLVQDPKLAMSTLAHELSVEDLKNTNAVKVLRDQHNHAIYFSRFPIPFSREEMQRPSENLLKHIGLYGFRSSFLKTFCETPVCMAEKAESLEQLRALHLGAKIYVEKVNYRSVGVDSPEDVKVVEKLLSENED